MLIESFILKDTIILDKNDSLAQFIRQIEKTGIDKALVTGYNQEGVKKLCGVVTSRDVLIKIVSERLRRTSLGRLRVSGFMTENPYRASLTTDIGAVVKIMSSRGYGIIPVENGSLHGAILRVELLKLLFEDDTIIKNLVDNRPLKVKPDDSLLALRQKIVSTDKSYAVVIGPSGDPLGYITIKEVAYAFATFLKNIPERFRKERISQLLVQDYMKKIDLEVKDTVSVGDVARKLYDARLKGAIVVGDEGFKGVITDAELINYLAINLLLGKQIGGQ